MGSRTRGRPPTRWIDDVENDLKTLNIKNWQRVAAYRWNWRKRAVEAAKTCPRFKLPQGVLAQNWSGTELNRSVTCMVLKATANDRRASSPLPL
ncbi:hypothetical protein TNCV_1158021 [Trichonephila clavipes]|nr:hypothetical protein TNCV_1158021 [Trichonephila clavipes]